MAAPATKTETLGLAAARQATGQKPPAAACSQCGTREQIDADSSRDKQVARLQWLVLLRWVAVAGLLITTWVASRLVHAVNQPGILYALAGALATANCLFWLVNRQLRKAGSLRLWSVVQGLADLAVLTLMLHYSGGIENPFMFFYIFHTVIASILLTPPVSYLHTITAAVLFSGLVLLEYFVPGLHHNLAGMVPLGLSTSPAYVGGVLISFCATLAITAHLTGKLAGELRRQVEERSRQERELANCTDQIAGLIHRAELEGTFDIRYENPHLQQCWELKKCERETCPAYNAENLRCWQLARKECLQAQPNDKGLPGCLECPIYAAARPDKITEIGESFNNMMCFLESHAREASDLQKQIMHQEKMVLIGQMAAGVAHEIGNPLASISSLVQYVARKTTDPAQKENLSLVNSHIERISRIVRDMVNFARPMDTDEEMLDVNEMVSQAVKMAKYDKRARKVEIDVGLSEGLPHTRASADQLTQVFVNIISNALDAMADGGTLIIVASEVNNEIQIAFSDTGVGMTEEQMRHIFEPFYTTKEVGQGTGLGLTVTDAIVRKLGGRITVHSRRGVGSTFTVCLPIRREKTAS